MTPSGIAVLNPTDQPATVDVGTGRGGRGYVGLFGRVVPGGAIALSGQDAKVLLYVE